MRVERKRLGALILAVVLGSFLGGVRGQELRWYKGNTHAHTTKSDGDATPRQAVRWYQDHEYNFLVITDHDHLTPVRVLDTDPGDDFLRSGEEPGARHRSRSTSTESTCGRRWLPSGEIIAKPCKRTSTSSAAGGSPDQPPQLEVGLH
jgi:hypothetical protein